MRRSKLNRPAFCVTSRFRGAFTLIELLVVIAIIAILASLLLPGLSKAKTKGQTARCLSNLRELGIGISLYTSEHNEKFPFKGSPWSWQHMAFVDAWILLSPYVPTNGSFYLCPADRGPGNFVFGPGMGVPTNDLPFPNSYWYWIAFWAEGSDFDLLKARQRSVNEVRYPSSKIIMDCEAIDPKDKQQLSAGGAAPQMHGKWRLPVLFVDGHSSIVWFPPLAGAPSRRTGVLQVDPGGPNGWGMGSLSWMDVP